MKLATISAPQWARTFQRGDYHVVIAPWVRDVAGYAQYYNEAHRPSNAHIILDNGAFEGWSMMPEDLVNAATLIGADEIVLPDVLNESKGTLKLSWQCARYLADETDIQGCMFVPQALTLEKWLECLNAWLEVWYTRGLHEHLTLSIGVPGHLREKWVPETFGATMRKLECTGLAIHLLGVQDVQEFIVQLPHTIGLRGVDTSLAFALGAHGKLLTPYAKKVRLGNIKQYDKLQSHRLPLIRLNILILRLWCEQGFAPDGIPIELVRQVAARESESPEIYTSPQFALRHCRVPEGMYAIHSQWVFPSPSSERGGTPDTELIGVYY